MARLKLKFQKRQIIVTVVLCVLLTLTAFSGVISQKIYSQHAQAVALAKEKAARAQVETVQNLRILGKTAEATKKVDAALRDPTLPAEQRYLLLIEKGNVPFDKADYATAVKIYEQAAGVSNTFGINQLLGLTWENIGDKDKAIASYKKAYALIPPNTPTTKANKATIKEDITRLGGTL